MTESPQELVGASALAAIDKFARRLDAVQIDRGGRIPELAFEGLRELGLFGLTLPAEQGGLEQPLSAAVKVIAVLAEHDRSVATMLGLHLGLGTRALVRFASPRLRARLLPPLASGEQIAAFSTTEPNAGSDLSKLSTTVALSNGALLLNGDKLYVTNGGLAGVLTVTARSAGDGLEPGMAMVAIPTGVAGLERAPEERKLGLRASSTTGFHLDNVRLPQEHLIGSPLHGAEQLDEVLAWGRTLMSSGCVGSARRALQRAREHTSVRRQFGKPLDQQPVVRLQLGLAAARLAAMDGLVERTAGQADGAELHRWSVSAKVFCSEGAWAVTDQALQLHGGSGYIEDTGLPVLLRDARVTRIFEGANDVLLTHAGALELKAPRAAGHSRVERFVSRQVKKLSKLGVRIFRRPELLHQLGRAVVLRDAWLSLAAAPEATRHVFESWLAAELHASLGRPELSDVDVLLENPT